MKTTIALVLGLALSLIGCSKAVTITSPIPPITAPVTTFTVKFGSFYDPGTFMAELDGQNVTSQFAPTAVAGGTALMRLPDTKEGFTNGDWIPKSTPPIPFPVGTLDPNIHFTPGVSTGSIPSGGSSGGTGKPDPNIAMYTHHLHVSARCNGMLCDTADDLVFFPIHLVGVPTSLTLKVGSTTQVMVETFPAMSVPLQVQVRPFNIAVSVGGLAPGAALFPVTIPPGKPSPPFSVTGMVGNANLILILEARGTQMGSIQGLVNP